MKYNLDENNQKWLDKIYEKIMAKMSAQCDRIGDKIPYIAEGGVYRDCLL